MEIPELHAHDVRKRTHVADVVDALPKRTLKSSMSRINSVMNSQSRTFRVKIGNKFDELMEIREGPKEAKQLVVEGQNNLAERMKVHVAR